MRWTARTSFARPLVLAVLVSSLGALGCTTARGRADDAYSHGRYLEAAELYDGLVKKDPKDKGALARRTEARIGALRQQLAVVTQARVGGHPELAAVRLEQLLAQRDAWGATIDAADAKGLTVEVVAAGSTLEAAVAAITKSVGPLAAEQLAQSSAPLLAHADLASWRNQISENLRAAGTATCASLATRATTPYWGWIVAGYCKHWGAPTKAPPRRANLYVQLVVEGDVGGASEGESARMRAALAAAFKTSVWFAPDGTGELHASLDGKVAASFDAHTVSRTSNWTEQVPYTEYEDVQESYQEPYNDTESYTEQVPHTEYKSESRPCGSSTCTDSVPVTVYSSESRTRTVTKYRTAYRTVSKPVTKYRDEPRSFTYEALERAGHYTSQLRVQLERSAPEITTKVDANFTDRGFDHDVINNAAGVSPQRANLMSLEDFIAREEGRLRDAFRQQLETRYAALYCSSSQYSLEKAAACLYLDPRTAPAPVHAALRAVFGEDEPHLESVLGRP